MINIVLVEDDPLLGPLYTHLLEEAGMRVTHLETAAQAMDSLKSQSADLVLLDVMLPQVSGLEFLPKLRAAFPNLPVVVLSNLHQKDLQIKAAAAGAIGYIIKSEHTPDTFIATVKEFLAVHQ